MGAIGFGLLMGALGFMIALAIICETEWGNNLRDGIGIGIIILLIFCFFILGYIGDTSYVNIENKIFCASFEAKKNTYEYAIKDENITGFERLQITQSIMELNGDLAAEQVNVCQWYNFNISEENRNKTLSLEQIK